MSAVVATITTNETITGSDSSSSSSRLPLTIRPDHYDIIYHRIQLEPSSTSYIFEGTVCIIGTAIYDTTLSSITVHAKELQLSHATFQPLDNNNNNDGTNNNFIVEADGYNYSIPNETCTILFGNNNKQHHYHLQKDQQYQIRINFIGILNNQMRGLYRSTYVGLDGTTKLIATTQFEPTDARRAFPCFDEPALKSTFQVTVTVPSSLQCISNTPTQSIYTKIQSNTNEIVKTVTFQITPKMSTYLVALIVGNFDSISETSRNIITTVYTVPGKAIYGEFCLQTATRCLDLYQDLYGIAYPLTKSDLIAIPDFAAGAMENWGCVTYREAKVLIKPGLTSETTVRGIARTVCHELAHQWFGNLVTMEWWTQLYLNEGMARFMEFVACTTLFPEWDMWTEFVQSVFGLAMALDAIESSHPVEVEVNHPDEIDSIFDAISYAKGASIVRMIATYIGMDTFFEGMRVYLTRHSYGNTVTNDLWQALQEVSGKPVVDFMNPWTKYMGYPIVSISTDGTIQVDRFLAGGPAASSSEPSVKWPIPLSAKVEGTDTIQGPWIIDSPAGVDDDRKIVEQKIQEWTSQSKWFKFNIDQTAFVRINYTQEQWKKLGTLMDPQSSPLSTTDRLGLLSDCFAAGKAGYTSITDAFVLIEKFGTHDIADYAVWQELSENLSALASLFRSEPFFDKFQSFLSSLYSKQLTLLGWEAQPNESGRTGTLRATVISMVGKTSNDDVNKKAFELFQASIIDPNGSALGGDVRSTIYRNALRYDEGYVYEALKTLYEKSSFPEEQRDCLSIMGCVKDPKRQIEMLDYIFDSGLVRPQDLSTPLSSLATATDEGGIRTWEYFTTNYDKLRKRFGSGPIWSVCVGMCCNGMATLDGAIIVESFFQNPRTPPASGAKRLAQALEVIRTKATRRERDRAIVQAYFEKW